MSAFSVPRIDRRRLLIGAGATALLSSGLVGCGGSKSESNSAGSNASVKLPSYLPIEGAKPDFPGTAEGVEAAYKLFPTDRKKTVKEMPGSGKDTVTAMVNTYAAIPPPMDKKFGDGVNAIIQGRKPYDNLDSLISLWRSSAKDAMRTEYQAQIQKGASDR